MPNRISRLLAPAILVFAVLIAVVNATIAWRSLQSLLRSQAWVNHTWEVISQVEEVVSTVKDAELGARGYVNTGNLAYLDTYRQAARQLPGSLQAFHQLTLENPVQIAHEAEMRQATHLRMDQLQRVIDLRSGGNSPELTAYLRSSVGLIQTTHLRVIADSMEGEERRLLRIRTARAKVDERHSEISIAVALGLDLLLILLMLRYFLRERLLRIAAQEDSERIAAARAETERYATELMALNTTLEERVRLRTSELETTNRELEAFSYSVSHDLRAPLRTIDGFSLALAEDYSEAVDAVGRDYIQRVRAGVQRMGGLIDALLQLSRITRADIVREDFDLSAVAESVAEHIREEDPERVIDFTVEDGLTANGDPKLIRVALENLLGNAAKFTSKLPHATVTFGWDPKQNAWCVRDNGAGFDMQYAGKLFHAFNRLHGDKDFKGSGIGLATVARVVHRHHGHIWAESTIDHGASFWFTLG